MQQQDVCARCAQPLAEDEARFNKVYWGMAHRRCRADAVWPPIFRPSLNPNEVMRQIFALCAHLGKLAAIGLPIPQFLPSHQQTAPTPQPPPQPQRMDADGDAKDTGDVVPVQQPTTNTTNNHRHNNHRHNNNQHQHQARKDRNRANPRKRRNPPRRDRRYSPSSTTTRCASTTCNNKSKQWVEGRWYRIVEVCIVSLEVPFMASRSSSQKHPNTRRAD